ncbi:hypothetical protein LTS15_005692 [Exophiala xenobiotica]|nr:hypothetical protein LTS15_005692 [Exophiala xenobiotica]
MIRFAVHKPAQNAQSIITSGAQMLAIDNPLLTAFNINVRPRLIPVPGHVLASPNVKYGAQKSAFMRSGSWDIRQVQFTTKANLNSWTYLWISSTSTPDPWRHEGELQASVTAFTSKLRELGFACNDCIRGQHVSVTPSTVDPIIDEAFRTFTSSPNRPPPSLVLVIIPSVDSAIYNRVKYACDVKEGLINVCAIASKFAKANDQYLANVALKFNLKLGGRNQNLEFSSLGVLCEGKTMVVGIDVTHPSPGSSSTAPSVVGIVASIDKWLGQWPADLAIQTARQEMVSGLKLLMESRLALWKRHNGSYPENILIYRHGVSEGQYNLGIPRVTIIIVGKRHHARFCPTKIEEADRSSNPHNGTVVDRGVTEARNWDFFLQAHTVIQGTARPAHYYIVFDEIFLARGTSQGPFDNAADVFENFTHNLCDLFGRATKAVSICPPAYYADLACERARCYLSGLFDPSTASSAGSVVEGGGRGSGKGDSNAGEGGTELEGPDSSSVRIHENVRNAMFHI